MQRKALQLFWRYTRPYSFRRWLALAGVTVSTAVESYVAPFILSLFIANLEAGKTSLDTAWPIITVYGFTLLFSTVISWRITLWATWTFEILAQRDLAGDIVSHLTSRSLSFHADRFSGSLISQSTKLLGAIERFWDVVIWDLLPILTGIVTSTVILSFIFWQYAVFLLIVSIVFCFAVYLGSRFMLELNKQEVSSWTKLTGRIADVVTNVSTVKAFGNEIPEYKSANTTSDFWRQKSQASMRGFLKVSTVWSLLITIAYIAALILTVLGIELGTLTIATAFLVLTYTMTVIRHLWNFNGVLRNYNRLMGDAHDMVEILNQEQEVMDTSTALLEPSKGKIEFRDVSFTHDDGEGVQVFNSLNLTMEAGEKVGVVGHSGSGKTTFTRLLLRFSDIDSGEIYIDGQNIAKVSQASLRKAISYVPQEPLLFHRSLEENIAYGKADATHSEVIAAAKNAHATEFIKTLPDSFATIVGERGVKLSGGQRQLVAIARAILKDAPILVLDEATSALDSESEKLIQDSLGELMKDRTSIVIAHRLSTIAKLDRIIVLEDGKIVEDGSHAELLKQNGIYSRLWNHQSGGFIEE